jgi:protein-ribulosamine 3-kinase
MKVDEAVIQILSLDPERTSAQSAGGGGCSSASTTKIVSKLEDGTEKQFFMKSGTGKESEIMFEGSLT